MTNRATPLRAACAKAVIVASLAAFATGCMEWTEVAMGGPGVVSDDIGSQVRITRADGSRIVLKEATVAADSIAGVDENGAPARVAMSDVQALEEGQVSPAVVLMPALIVIAIVVPRIFSKSLRGPDSTVAPAGP